MLLRELNAWKVKPRIASFVSQVMWTPLGLEKLLRRLPFFKKIKRESKNSSNIFFIRLLKILLFFFKFNSFLARKTINGMLRHNLNSNKSRFSKSHSVRSREMTKNRHAVLMLAPIDFNFRQQRPQQVMKEFSKLNLESLYLNASSKPIRKQVNPHLGIEIVDEVKVINLHLNSNQKYFVTSTLKDTEAHLAAILLEDLFERTGISSVTIICEHPCWAPLVERLSNNRVIYDCIDDHMEFGNLESDQINNELKVVQFSDAVVCTSEKLHSKLGSYRKDNLQIIRNGVTESWTQDTAFQYPVRKAQIVIGYFGAIASWFDSDLIDSISVNFPNIKLELIGEVSDFSIIKKLKERKNVNFLGELTLPEVREIAENWTVATIPFREVPLTISTNPVKLYEYAALGLPVVSTNLPEVQLAAKEVTGIYVAKNTIEFIEMIKLALAMDNAKKEELRKWSNLNTWKVRVEELRSLAEKEEQISVVIVMWNASNYVIKCLASVLYDSNYSNLQVIVVDNNSDLAEKARVKDWIEEFGNNKVKIISNLTNLGFAGGVNIGVSQCTSRLTWILNSDIEVFPGIFHRSLKHFRLNSNLGILGCLTDNCGNEAQVSIPNLGMRDIAVQRFGLRKIESVDIEMVGFYAVCISREAWERIGPMDEDFGLGYFEDDDYCLRAKDCGFDVRLAKDIFVRHYLSATFGLLSIDVKAKLLAENREKFNSKHFEMK